MMLMFFNWSAHNWLNNEGLILIERSGRKNVQRVGSQKCLPTSARAILGFEKANPVGVCSTVKIPNNKVFGKPRPVKKTDGEHYQEPSCIFSYFNNFCKNTKKDKQPIWATPLIALSHLVWLPLVQPAVEITFKALLPNPLTFKPDHNKQLRLMTPCLISEVR